MTLKTSKYTKSVAQRLLFTIGETELPKPDVKGKYYSGKLIFSKLLPKDLNMEYETKMGKVLKDAGICRNKKDEELYDTQLKIKNGLLVSGVIDENSLGEGQGKLVEVLARDYPNEVIAEFYDKAGKLAVEIISLAGMTVGLDEYSTSNKIESVKKKALEEGIDNAKKVGDKFKRGTLQHIPGRTLEESFEIHMMRIAAEVKQKVEKEILKERVQQLLEKPTYNSIVMILSGSRGSIINLTNITGLWGQASVREGRPKRGFKDRAITRNTKGDFGLMAGGFITKNFMEGMNQVEYFFHAMGGRQGEVDTGVSTKVSGYLYRRLASALKDLSINSDLTVRTAGKEIIQYYYGEDGVFPTEGPNGKTMNVEKEAGKILSEKR